MHLSNTMAGDKKPDVVTVKDPLWDKAVHEIVRKLPEEQVAWLLQEENQKPFSMSQLVELVTKTHSANSNRILHRFFSKIDPILSHLSSFQASVNIVVQDNLMITGTIWAAFHMLIQVSRVTRAEN
jgi:hypothetical protein